MSQLTIGPCKRLLLFGGGQLIVDLAEWAHNYGLSVSVITSPRHAIAPLSSSEGSMSDILASKEIQTTVVESITSEEAKRAIGNCVDTFALSIGSAWIFRKDFVDQYLAGCLFNLHGTRLPQNRGGGGFSWQILTANRFGFCTLHLVDNGVDTGDIVSCEEFIYPSACRVPADYMRVYRERNLQFISGLLVRVSERSVTFDLISQPEYLSTYWPRLNTPDQAWIDWSWPAHQLERFICAFDDPYSGAQTTWRGTTVRVKKVFASDQDGAFHPFQAGLVYRNNGRWLCVASNGGSVVIESLADESNKNILAEMRVGDRFYTPIERLAEKAQRVIYNSLGLIKK